MMSSQEIRQTFLQFFANKQHAIVPSAPMVVKNDPTLMFTNAGMNQFKDWFLGNTPPDHPRVADTQKCLRVSGKHNDLEEVGHDTYHHTMFEMMGNWSFGDYFKQEAIAWAWELLTEVYKIDRERLYVTFFEGHASEGLEADTEALAFWRQFLPDERILRGARKDNFWEMGDVGPCGPCSEIHADLRDASERQAIDGATLVNRGHPLVVEIWNLVFIQYNRKASGELELLPKKHVDTGMGFERLCMLLQGVQSNYDTDVFQPVIREIARLSGKIYGAQPQQTVAMRVIADHLRACCFSIADGQLPSNAKAGYVIRRILRRAVRYGYTFLGFNEPFICRLVPALVAQMGAAYPELQARQTLIEQVLREEETAFLRTLETGIRLLETVMEKNAATKIIAGKEAFQLYDTYGFPVDLTALMAREKGFEVDMPAFEKELENQKQRSRNAAATEESDWITVRPAAGPTVFVGYDMVTAGVHIVRYRTVKTKGKEQVQLVFDRTPFYGESGGQTGDAGVIGNDREQIIIVDTKKENKLTVHLADRLPDDVAAGFTAQVDTARRQATACNHTATHLLHHALRSVLGGHVEQKGSLVSADYLRFDFSHFQKVTDEEIRRVEHLVNAMIRANSPLEEHRRMPVAEAQAMGAMALFGEKYEPQVRVVRYGESVELCGGTHVGATGEIGFFRIIGESAVAAGVRRIEAVSASGAEALIDGLQDMVRSVGALFNNAPNVVQAIRKVISDNTSLEKQVQAFVAERVEQLKASLERHLRVVNGCYVAVLQAHIPPDMVKDLAFRIRNAHPALLFVGGVVHDGRPSLTVALSDDMVERGLNAALVVREAAKEIGGSGGGQKFLATAGGKNPDGLQAAIDKVIALSCGEPDKN
ncbi:MAG: alanine--tRNA ligase [Prevotellaceae bacterium]|jgi:alanyl-tRNA synthetase|nr:alanine--tRNA ligase [Prevotellaceae bacterium]